MRYLLFVVCRVSFAFRWQLLVVRCALFVVCGSLLDVVFVDRCVGAVVCSSFAVRCWFLFVVCGVLIVVLVFVVCCVMCVVLSCLLFVIWCMRLFKGCRVLIAVV